MVSDHRGSSLCTRGCQNRWRSTRPTSHCQLMTPLSNIDLTYEVLLRTVRRRPSEVHAACRHVNKYLVLPAVLLARLVPRAVGRDLVEPFVNFGVGYVVCATFVLRIFVSWEAHSTRGPRLTSFFWNSSWRGPLRNFGLHD